MKVRFIFKYNQKEYIKETEPEEQILKVINEILEEESELKDLELATVSANGQSLITIESFEQNGINDNDLILVENKTEEVSKYEEEIRILKDKVFELEEKYQILDDKLTSYINLANSRKESLISPMPQLNPLTAVRISRLSDNGIKYNKKNVENKKSIDSIDSFDNVINKNNEDKPKEIIPENNIISNIINNINNNNINNHIDNSKIMIQNELIDFEQNEVLQKFISDPTRLSFKYFISTGLSVGKGTHYFIVFKSLLEDTYVVYSYSTGLFSFTSTIECYSLDKKAVVKKIHNINGHHLSIKHCCDLKNKKDYIITSSNDKNDKSIKVYDIYYDWNCIINIQNPHENDLFSAIMLSDNKSDNCYIVSSADYEPLKIWDFSGKFVAKLAGENEADFLDYFFDTKEDKLYITTGNNKDVKVYNFNEKTLFKSYQENNEVSYHYSVTILESEGTYKLIESDSEGYVRVWGFNSAVLFSKIKCGDKIKGICVWNEWFVLACGCKSRDNVIKLVNIKEGKVVKEFKGHTRGVCSVKKFIHPRYGEAIISLGYDGLLKLWLKK